MTKRSKSGTVGKLTPKLKTETISDAVEVTEVGAVGAPVQDINWTAQQVEARSETKFEDDTGEGKPIILRQFEFALPKELPMSQLPTKTQLLEFHKSKVIAFLWKDELELIQEPKIVMEGGKFRIFATCQPLKGSMLSYKNNPQLLIDVAQGRTR